MNKCIDSIFDIPIGTIAFLKEKHPSYFKKLNENGKPRPLLFIDSNLHKLFVKNYFGTRSEIIFVYTAVFLDTKCNRYSTKFSASIFGYETEDKEIKEFLKCFNNQNTATKDLYKTLPATNLKKKVDSHVLNFLDENVQFLEKKNFQFDFDYVGKNKNK